MTAIAVDEQAVEIYRPPKWLLIVSGVLWLLLAFVVLSFDSTSAATIGYLTGFVLIMAGIDEFMIMVVAPGWRWLHVVMAVIFILSGVLALLAPFQTFGLLTVLIGWYLLIKGFFDMALSIGARQIMHLWGLGLAAGIIEILLGLWALGYPGRSAWLLVLWVGFAAVMRGVGNLFLAFSNEGAH